MGRGQPSFSKSLIARRLGSSAIDWCIEGLGGMMGSYFGMVIAAVMTAMRDEPPIHLHDSIWSGFGFGFAISMLSVSLINRVFIQGISRASIGKKIFQLEISSTQDALTWKAMFTRWAGSYLSLLAGGFGYAYIFFNPENRAYHDVISQMEVVEMKKSSFAVAPAIARAPLAEVIPIRPVAPAAESPNLTHELSKMIILANNHAERPTATVIQMPMRAGKEEAVSVMVEGNLAQVLDLHPAKEKAAVETTSVEELALKKRA